MLKRLIVHSSEAGFAGLLWLVLEREISTRAAILGMVACAAALLFLHRKDLKVLYERARGHTLPENLLAIPANAPRIVPVRFGNARTLGEHGYYGLGMKNDGNQTAYEVAPISPVKIERAGELEVWDKVDRLSKDDAEGFFRVFITPQGSTGTFGSAIYDFMVDKGLDSLTIPFTYRDAKESWYQTDVIIVKDQMARKTAEDAIGGIRLEWRQTKIPSPKQQ